MITRLRQWLRPGSLRARLLWATWLAIAIALLLTGLALTRTFAQYARAELKREGVQALDQLTALLELDGQGGARLDAQRLLDPAWMRPYSGQYWQVNNAQHQPVLRSRSLWDERLMPDPDLLDTGVVHDHLVAGPNGQEVLVVERGVLFNAHDEQVWRVIVALDTQAMAASVQSFSRFTVGALLLLMLLLAIAAWAQVRVGLAPLGSLQQALGRVKDGQSPDLGDGFPDEVQPLVDSFNAVLQRQRDMVARARQQAGNLAHGLKTPLAVIRQAAQAAPAHDELARTTLTQVEAARRQLDWHLARARAQAVHQQAGVRAEVGPTLATITQAMNMIHRDKGLDVLIDWDDDALCFAGEAQDLQEILGNLVDNAYQWARTSVSVRAQRHGERSLRISITDDGPGLSAAQREQVLQRGQRLDESMPGSGLGLAIAHDLTTSYGGQLRLSAHAPHGLRVELDLPRAEPHPAGP